MSLSDFLSPLDPGLFPADEPYATGMLGSVIGKHLPEHDFPSLEGIQLAFLGVEEDRFSLNNEGCAQAPDVIRKQLYLLQEGSFKSKIVDLGNIHAGASIRDTYVALREVTEELMRHHIIPIILGGGNNLAFAQYQAYRSIEQRVDLVSIDSRFDLDITDEGGEMTSRSYLNHIILDEPNNLFNFSNIGYQTYFASQESLRLMDKMYFDIHRLGTVIQDLRETEPIIRNANMMSFDLSAIRQSDAPGTANAGPNGFYGEQACQICRYAGMNDKLLSIGFYEMNPKYDHRGQTAQLVAQMIWCFIEGYYHRKQDYPFKPTEEMTKFHAFLDTDSHEVIFYKSPKTGRWWMQVPYPSVSSMRNERFYLVPCSYTDYQQASTGEIPDRWWRTFRKLV